MASSLTTLIVVSCYFTVIFSNETPKFDINCKTLVPVGSKANQVSTLSATPEYTIQVARHYSPGGTLPVSIKGRVLKFLIQTRQPATTTTLGTWSGASDVQIRKCNEKGDTAIESDDTIIKDGVNITWTAPQGNSGMLYMVATIINHDGKFFEIQSNMLSDAVPAPAPVVPQTTAFPDTEQEGGSRRTNEEPEEPEKPNEKPVPRNPEDPNAFEKDQERLRQESLRRDKDGDKAMNKSTPSKSENEVVKKTAQQQNRDEEDDETSAHRSALEEEEQEEMQSRKRAQAEEEESRSYNNEEEGQSELNHGEQMRIEIRQMEEQMAKEDEERLRMIRWEEEDAKRYRQELEMEKRREEELKRKEELLLEKEKKLQPVDEDEILVDKDENIVLDGESGAAHLFVSMVTMIAFVMGAFFF